MDQETTPELRRSYRRATFFWGIGTVGPLPIYVVGYAFARSQIGFSSSTSIKPELAYLILLGLAALTSVTIRPFSRFTLSRNMAATISTFPYFRLSDNEMRLFRATGTISAMTHATAVVGFALAFVTGRPALLYLGVLLSLALLLLYFPRYNRWEEWSRELE